MHRTIVFLFIALLAAPFAHATECTSEANPLLDSSVQAISAQFSELKDADVRTIARYMQTASELQAIASDESTAEHNAKFAAQAVDIVIGLAAFHHTYISIFPQWDRVRVSMKREQDAGLKKVSDELLPDVRLVARQMIVLGQLAADHSTAAALLGDDHFVDNARSQSDPDVVCSLERTMNIMESAADVLENASKILPGAVALAYVENLYY